MKIWQSYFDSNGLLCQKGPTFDGGDTPCHSGLCYSAKYLGCDFPTTTRILDCYRKLTTSSGLLFRNPVNYNNPSDTSRDQYVGFVCGLLINYYRSLVYELYDALPRNFLKWPVYPNGDLFTIQDYVLFNRYKVSRFVREIGDFLLLLEVLVQCFWTTRVPGKIATFLYKLTKWNWLLYNASPNAEGVPQDPRGPESTSNDLNVFHQLLVSKLIQPSLMSRIASKIYACYRPKGIQYAFDSYFEGDMSPPVNILLKPVIKRYFYA
jgi:hypothetical protein